MTDFGVLLLFFIIWVICNIYYYKTQRSNHIGVLLLGIYGLSSFFSIVYFLNPYFESEYYIQLWPLLLWALYFFINFIPIIKFDRLSFSSISYSSKLLQYVCVLALVLSIVPIIEELLHFNLIFSSNDLAQSLSDIHDDSEKENYLSFVGKTCLHLLRWIYELVLLSSYFVLKSKNKLSIAGIFASIIAINLYALTMSSRGQILTTLLNLFLIFLLYFPIISKKESKTLLRIGFYVVGFLVLFFSIITILRSSVYASKGNGLSLDVFLIRYVGESFINIGEYWSHLNPGAAEGDYCFYTLKQMFLLDPHIIDRNYVYTIMSSKLGIRLGIFYSYISYFVFDLGFGGALVFFLLVSYLMKRVIVVSNNEIKFSTLYLIFIYSSIILNGTCIYMYISAISERLFVSLLIFFFLRYKRI